MNIKRISFIKQLYFEINKIYAENDINLKAYIDKYKEEFIRSNIINYKKLKPIEKEIVIEKFYKYIDLMKKKQINYKTSNKKNLEAFELVYQIPIEYTKKEYRNKLNKLIDQLKEEVIKDTWYLARIRKTKGKSAYIHIITLDRLYFEDSKEVKETKIYTNNIYYDPTTGRRCKEDNPNAKILKKKGTKEEVKKKIYISDKTRLFWINTNPKEEKINKEFNKFTDYIRKFIYRLIKNIFSNEVLDVFLMFKKQHLKRKIKKKGKVYYINKKTYLYDQLESYEKRKIDNYNATINMINLKYQDILKKGELHILKMKEHLESLLTIKNIKYFEEEIAFFKDIYLKS